MNREELEQYTWDFLMEHDLPEYSAAAVMGNIEAESEFDPNLVEGGSGIGFGLCQWSFERRENLEKYGTDIDHQLQFMADELLKTNYTNGLANNEWIGSWEGITHDMFLRGESDIATLTGAMCFCWERPDPSVAHLERRQKSAQNYYDRFHGSGGGSSSEKVENAVKWMIEIANDDTHGYDQTDRWGPDYDCSSFVISGYEQAGIPLKSNGASYTGDMYEACIKTGFKTVDWGNDVGTLKRGDILLNVVHHTCCYIGDGKIVQASSNEFGGVTGGETGDQTGKEIYIRDYYKYPNGGWDYVLRYGKGGSGGGGGEGGGEIEFDDNYLDKWGSYFEKYDDLSEVWKKINTTPYKINQLSESQTRLLRTLNFEDGCKMLYTFEREKKFIGTNFLGKRLTFTDKDYIIKDVRNNGNLQIVTSTENVCYNFLNPKFIYQTDDQKKATKEINKKKVQAHVDEEKAKKKGDTEND